MRRNVTRVLIVAVAALGLLASACGDDDDKGDGTTTTEASKGGDRGNADGELKLGTLVPQTGDLSAIVKSLQTPVDMAVASINAAGGVNGKPVVVGEAGARPPGTPQLHIHSPLN